MSAHGLAGSRSSFGRASGRWAGRAADRIEAGLGGLAAVLLAILLLTVLTAVCLRYVFHTGLVGSEELAIWLHVALIGLAAPLGLNGPLSMRLDVAVRSLPGSGRAAAQAAGDVFSILAALTLAGGGLDVAVMLGSTSPSLGMPEWIRFGFVAAGGALVLLLLVLRRTAEGTGAAVLMSLLIGGALYLCLPLLEIEAGFPPSLVALLITGAGLLLGAPLAHVFLTAVLLVAPFGSSLPEPAILSSAVGGMSKFLLLAIPFFLLAGGLLTASGAAACLVRLAVSLVGHRRGGLAQTVLLAGVFFSGGSGSSVANAAFAATSFHPELVRGGYGPERAGAIIAATSVLDNVIPPSIAFLILAAATNLSVGSLLVGGALAGVVMAVCLAAAFHLTAEECQARLPASARERRQALVAAVPALGLAVIVVAGIRLGIVTTTEAAALAAAYALLLGLCNRSGMCWPAFRQAACEASAVGLLIGSAAPLAFLLAADGAAGVIAQAVTVLGANPVWVLLLCNLVLLLAGLVLDIGAAILLLGPILLPVAVVAGIDPIHFGVILVVNLMIGGLTPPVGILVYVVSGVTRVPASSLFRSLLPYHAALLVALFLLCLFALIV